MGISKNWITWCEIALSAILMVAIDYSLPVDTMGFLDIEPHPYWIPILFFSVRYSMRYSLSCAAVYAFLHSFFTYQTLDYSLEDFLTIEHMIHPFSFIIVASVLSNTIQRHHQLNGYLREETIKKDLEIDSMNKIVRKSEQTIIELERNIVQKKNSYSHVVRLAEYLESFDEKKILVGLLKGLWTNLHIIRSSAYCYTNEGLQLVATWGETSKTPNEIIISPTPLMHATALQRTIQWHQKDCDFDDPDLDTVCCGPIILSDGTIYGFVCVHELPFIWFHADMVKNFLLLNEWTGRCIDRSREYQKQKKHNILDNETNVYTYNYMAMNVQRQIYSYTRYSEPSTVVFLRCQSFDCNQTLSLRLICHLLSQHVRQTDLLGKAMETNSFLILLPNSEYEAGKKCAQKLKGELEQFFDNSLGPVIHFEWYCLQIQNTTQSVEELIEAAQHNPL